MQNAYLCNEQQAEAAAIRAEIRAYELSRDIQPEPHEMALYSRQIARFGRGVGARRVAICNLSPG